MRTPLPLCLTLTGLASGTGCTPHRDPGGASFSLQLQLPAAAAVNITSVEVEVFDEGALCNGPDVQGGNSLVRQAVDITTTTSIEVSPGRRFVSAVALDGTTRVARGCARVDVTSGSHVSVMVQLAEFPPIIDGPPQPDGGPDADIPDGMIPGEDDCDTPGTIAAGGGTFTGTTVGTIDDVTPSCGTAGNGDAFWAVTITTPSELDVTLRDTSGTHSVAVYRGTCGALVELACASSGDPDVLTDVPLTASGTYYIVVDDVGMDSGDYSLQVVTSSVALAEDCANPGTLTLGTLITGATVGAFNDTTGSCVPAANGTRDAVYRFDLADAQYVRVQAAAGPNTFWLYARDACPMTGAELACIGDIASSAAINLGMAATGPLPAGDYYVFLDANNGGGTTVVLSATTLAPPNDACTSVPTIAPGTTLGTWIGANNSGASCGVGGGADVFYQFTTTAAKHVTATVTAANAAVDPVLSLRTTCAGSEVAGSCTNVDADATETMDIASLPADTYFLVVDSNAAGTTSSFTIDLAIVDP